MNHPLRLALSAICLLLTQLFISATILSGITIDENDRPVEGAAVVVVQLPDSTYIDGTTTDADGLFSIDSSVDISKICIKAEAIGYEKETIKPKNATGSTIKLQSKALSLGEVVVKPTSVTVSPGKFAFTLGDLAKNATDAFDALTLVPMLSIDKFHDKIELPSAGKSTVYINGKKSYMSQNAIVQMLLSSQPNRIKRVELWLNPGVEYFDEGAIINIVLAPKTGTSARIGALAENADSRINPSANGWLGIERDLLQVSADLNLIPYSEHLQKRHQSYTQYDTSSPSRKVAFSRDINTLSEQKHICHRQRGCQSGFAS